MTRREQPVDGINMTCLEANSWDPKSQVTSTDEKNCDCGPLFSHRCMYIDIYIYAHYLLFSGRPGVFLGYGVRGTLGLTESESFASEMNPEVNFTIPSESFL
jgi:hypothetical protein